MPDELLKNIYDGVRKHLFTDIIIPVAASVAKPLFNMKTAASLNTLTEFKDVLQTTSNQQQIYNVYIALPEECKVMLCKQTQKNLTNPYFCSTKLDVQQKSAIAGEIESCQSNLVNIILLGELFCASVLLWTQWCSLQELTEELKSTGKLVGDSKSKVDSIIKKLGILKATQIELNQAIENLKAAEAATKTIPDRETLLELYCDLTTQDNKKTEIFTLISTLKVDVNGSIVQLGDKRQTAQRDAVVNVAHVVANLLEYSIAGGMYTAAVISIKAVLTTASALMSYGKYQQSVQAAKRIEELAEILNKVEALEKEAEPIKKVIEAAVEWIKEKKKTRKRESDGGRPEFAEVASGQSAI